jgi:hypothetical protein
MVWGDALCFVGLGIDIIVRIVKPGYLSMYGDTCQDFINWCGTETNIVGFEKCINLFKASVIKNKNQTSSMSKTSVSTEDVSNWPYACPNTYASCEEESCTTKISSKWCKANEFLPCYPLWPKMNPTPRCRVQQGICILCQCPMYECFEASELAGNQQKNMTAYTVLYTYSNICEKIGNEKWGAVLSNLAGNIQKHMPRLHQLIWIWNWNKSRQTQPVLQLQRFHGFCNHREKACNRSEAANPSSLTTKSSVSNIWYCCINLTWEQIKLG